MLAMDMVAARGGGGAHTGKEGKATLTNLPVTEYCDLTVYL